MTKEKAIEILKYIKHVGNGESEYVGCAQEIALDMAIKALEQKHTQMIYIVTDKNKKYIYDGYMFSFEWDIETQDYIVVVRIPSNGKITFINGSKSIEYLVFDNNVIIDKRYAQRRNEE